MPGTPTGLTPMLAQTVIQLFDDGLGPEWGSDEPGGAYGAAADVLDILPSTVGQRLLSLERLGYAKLTRSVKGQGHLRVLSVRLSDDALPDAMYFQAEFNAAHEAERRKAAAKAARRGAFKPAAALTRVQTLRASAAGYHRQRLMQLQ